jgi:hypothetical protein
VTEVHRTRDPHDRVTLVDQCARPFSYRSDELDPTAIPGPSNVYRRCICQEPTR